VNPLLGGRQINRLAIPALLAGITEPILSITDTAIVGHIPENGVASLAAAGIVGSFLSMLVWILGQTSSALSAIVAQYYGAQKLEELRSLPSQTILVNVLAGVVLLVLTLPFSSAIFRQLNASGEIMQLSLKYYSIRAWGFPLTLFVFGVMGVFQGLQNTSRPMIIALTGALLNVALDLILVYGITGWVPAMGLEGAAWASLISQLAMVAVAAFYLFRYSSISMMPALRAHPELLKVLGMAGNLFLRSLALNIALLFAVRQAAALGEAAIGAHTIAINLWLFAAFFIDGYSVAGKILAGRFLGAKDYHSLWKLSNKIMRYGLGVTASLMLFGILLYKYIGYWFSVDSGVLMAFQQMFIWVIVGLPICGVAFIYDGIFKGLGKTKLLRNVLILSTFLGYLPFLYFTQQMDWGLPGIWGALMFWMILRGGILVLKFRRDYYPQTQKP
jgi:putative MATE family efflux protein